MAGNRDRTKLPPCSAVVVGALDPTCPSAMALDGSGRKYRPIHPLNGLILDRPQQSGRERLDLCPIGAVIGGTADESGPGHRAFAGLVEQENCAALALKQHRIPAW